MLVCAGKNVIALAIPIYADAIFYARLAVPQTPASFKFTDIYYNICTDCRVLQCNMMLL